MTENKSMRICMTTYIYGDKYQDYIPMLIFSIKKAYPTYSIMLFINGKLRPDLQDIINKLKLAFDDFEIIENVFDDCKNMNRLAAKSFRWVLWDERFKTFDYMYFIDADMLYIKEPIPLHEQHIRHMKFINDKGISNIVRKKVLYNNIISGLHTNYKHVGFKGILHFFRTKRVCRLTGLHFVKVNEYYEKINAEIRNKYRQYIYDGKIINIIKYASDEVFLYQMVKETGWDMSHFAFQTTSISMFGFNQPVKPEFRPHHGIHLGIFRKEINKIKSSGSSILESDDYKYYIEQFKETYLSDPLFNEIYKILPDNIKVYFNRMLQYYNIK